MKLVSVPEMQQIERQADAGGLTYAQMMDHAGAHLAETVALEYGMLEKRSVLGLVGSGNNGGDTLVALTSLADQGWQASAYLVRDRPEDDPLIQRLRMSGGEVIAAEEAGAGSRFPLLEGAIAACTVLLDGVFGTGIHLPLKPEAATYLDIARQTIASLAEPPYVVAVDCPSGVDCESGEAAPETIPADLTVTMAAVKTGLLKFPAYRFVGGIRVAGIGLNEMEKPPDTWQSIRRFVADADLVKSILPKRPMDAHKGTFGTALVAGGSVNYTGAILMAGEAAYRIGAGLVTLAIPGGLHTALAGQLVEATWLLLPDEMGVIARDGARVILDHLGRATALLVGPGLGMEDITGEFLERLLKAKTNQGARHMGFSQTGSQQATADIPKQNPLPGLVIDADGLKQLAQLHDWPSLLPKLTVLTPHPGEMSVLTGLDIQEIQKDRIGTAERFASQWGHVVVLKGAFTVIADPSGEITIIPVATSALARAGTGDVLAGLITGLRAQGVDAYHAAIAGAWIHAQAGLYAAYSLGNTASVLAGDVLASVPDVLADLSA
jgi:NAD(P)H-hydrate epimerase